MQDLYSHELLFSNVRSCDLPFPPCGVDFIPNINCSSHLSLVFNFERSAIAVIMSVLESSKPLRFISVFLKNDELHYMPGPFCVSKTFVVILLFALFHCQRYWHSKYYVELSNTVGYTTTVYSMLIRVCQHIQVIL